MARCLDRERETCRIRTLILSTGGCLPSVVDEKRPLAEGTAAPTSLGIGSTSAGCAKLPWELLACDGPGLLSEETLGGVVTSLTMACCWTVLLGHAGSSTGGVELLLLAALSRNRPGLLAEEA